MWRQRYRARMQWRMVGRALQAEAEDVAHVVEARLAADDPERRANGADREGVARAGAVGDLDAVAVAQEHDRVIADDVAAAQGLDADLAGAAGADVAVARVAGGRRQVSARALRDGFGQAQGGAGRRVFLAAVVGPD